MGTVIILVFTVILAGVAIFTALRLYQLRSQPVAPNVPSSIPRAAENACTLSFTITPQTPGLNCTGKFAFADNSGNSPGVYQFVDKIEAGSNVAPGQTFVYAVAIKNTGTGTANSVVITDILPTNVSFKDANTECVYTSSTRTVSCNLGNMVAGGASQRAIRVSVLASATGSFTNTATISSTGGDNSSCQIALNVQTSTGSPTETPTSTPGPSGTPNSCGGTCGSNTNCGSGLYCNTSVGFCRNASCPNQADCNCPGTSAPTPTPTAPSLPKSGTDWPTVVGAGVGVFVVIGSLLLAL